MRITRREHSALLGDVVTQTLWRTVGTELYSVLGLSTIVHEEALRSVPDPLTVSGAHYGRVHMHNCTRWLGLCRCSSSREVLHLRAQDAVSICAKKRGNRGSMGGMQGM